MASHAAYSSLERSAGTHDRSVAICMAACTGLLCVSYAWASTSISYPSGWWAFNFSAVGHIIGVLLGGLLADGTGRKMAIVIGSVVFVAGRWTFVFLSSEQEDLPIAALFVQSIGSSIYLFALPVYCVEVAAKEKRGLIAGYAALLLGVGNFLGYLHMFEVGFRGKTLVTYVLPQVPMLLFAIGCVFLPESARWACLHKGRVCAETSLETIRGTTCVQSELNAIAMQVGIVADTAGWSTLTRASIVKRIIAVSVLLIIESLASSAVNTWLSTLLNIQQPEDFAMSIFGGFTYAYLLIVYILPAIPALYVVYAFGRRRLLLIGGVGMIVAHAIVGIALESGCEMEFRFTCTQGSAVGVFIGTMTGVLSYGACWAPVLWLYPAEIFPTNVRSKATAISAALAGVSPFWVNKVVSKLFDLSLLSIGSVIFCFVALLIVKVFCPETHRLELEDMEELFADGFHDKQQISTTHASENLSDGRPTQLA